MPSLCSASIFTKPMVATFSASSLLLVLPALPPRAQSSAPASHHAASSHHQDHHLPRHCSLPLSPSQFRGDPALSLSHDAEASPPPVLSLPCSSSATQSFSARRPVGVRFNHHLCQAGPPPVAPPCSCRLYAGVLLILPASSSSPASAHVIDPIC
ncbi:hypothetical protein M0R45_018838 [Rubus argutus]|uniref:Uncharacterized protein n=1 Tax=Rubus argutus TaxID=59490 RepID=A0AAW1X5F4_RUBAR